MKIFNPVRLKDARHYRKMTIEELATSIGIKKQSVSQFENSKSTPDFDTLYSISQTLDFPVDFFVDDVTENIKTGNTYFRALFSCNKKDQNSQKIKTLYLTQIYYYLRKYINFPKFNIPNIEFTNDIEKTAMALRDYWGLGQEPIADMVSLLERNGIIVSEFSTEGEIIDAFSQYNEIDGEGFYCIVLGTDKNSFVRRQFSSAHELGHILLHENFEDLNEINREDFRQRETEANKFASAFLLPKEAFTRDLSQYSNKLNYYVELKRKWKVSISAMIMRAYDLEIINPNQYQYLMRQVSQKSWRTREPLDDVMIVRRPKALRQAINLLLLNNILTGSQILHVFAQSGLALPKEVIDEVLGLDADTILLDLEEPDPVLINSKQSKIFQLSQLKKM